MRRLASVPTERGAHTIGFDAARNTVYAFLPESHRAAPPPSPTPRSTSPRRILTSRTALEGERKQVTVLFADLKGSMELLADRDPEEARGSSSIRFSNR